MRVGGELGFAARKRPERRRKKEAFAPRRAKKMLE